MKKKTLADGILAVSAAAALGTAPFMDMSPLWGGLFHVSFAATVAGFADWFGVTSLFRRPFGIPYRTDLIARSRDKIVAMARDMVMEELLTERRMKALLVEHTASSVVEGWLGKNRDGVRKILVDAAMVTLLAVDKGWLWQVTGGNLSRLAENLDWAGYLSSVMKSFRSYEGRDELLAVLSSEVRSFLQDEFTLEEVRRIYLSAWEKYEETGWFNFHRIFKNVMKDREEEMVTLVRGKIISLADMLTDPESDACRAIGGKYDEIVEKLASDTALKERLNRFVAAQVKKGLAGRGKVLFESLWNGKQEELAAYAADGVLALADAMLQDERKRRTFDAFLLHGILPHVGELHDLVGKVVEKKLDHYDGRSMAKLAEEGAGEDVAMIRINGSLFGAVLGLLFYAATAAGGAL